MIWLRSDLTALAASFLPRSARGYSYTSQVRLSIPLFSGGHIVWQRKHLSESSLLSIAKLSYAQLGLCEVFLDQVSHIIFFLVCLTGSLTPPLIIQGEEGG